MAPAVARALAMSEERLAAGSAQESATMQVARLEAGASARLHRAVSVAPSGIHFPEAVLLPQTEEQPELAAVRLPLEQRLQALVLLLRSQVVSPRVASCRSPRELQALRRRVPIPA